MAEEDLVMVPVFVFGKLHMMQMKRGSAETYMARLRAGQVELEERREQARALIDEMISEGNSEDKRALATALKAIERYCFFVDSARRISLFLDLIQGAPSNLFWWALLRGWSGFDDTWGERARLLRELKENARLLDPHIFMKKFQREAFAELPDPIAIYRGCSRERVRGISWSVEREVAMGFARGHRGIPVPNASLASAKIAKKHVFAYITARHESEVLINPRHIRGLVLDPVL